MKKITIISRHFFSAFNRKTTVHFLAREFVKKGYESYFVSVGRSRLSTVNKPKNKGLPADINRDTFTEVEPNIFSIVMDEYIHPFSTSNKLLNVLTTPKLLNYGNTVPESVLNKIKDSDIILIECGYGVAYFNALKKLCKKAKFIYFATDPLSQVGLRKEFEDIELEVVPKFDLVRVASKELGERFSQKANLVIIPQGLDKTVFDKSNQSPYEKDTVNFVSIGDMSFDYESIVLMAKLKPEFDFHIFGANIPVAYPKNVKIYGEMDFNKLVPYIKFADVGIMPYKMTGHLGYLTKTSLKFLQYTYCGLPIVTPSGPDWDRKNIFQYTPQDKITINNALEESFKTPKDISLSMNVIDWGTCTEMLTSAL